MNVLRAAQKRLFDIRPGEYLRTWSMFLYLLCVLFAYYILKPVSRSMFLTRFDADKLPWLYILIAAFGGVFAYLYSKLASRTSLRSAVLWTMSVSTAALCGIWALIGMPWMVYVLNIFVSLFSIVLVSQGWLVASNIFDAREAKRIYPLLGVGMVLGAAFGGEFTHMTALLLGTRNLLLASAGMVILAYGAYRLSVSASQSSLKAARAGDEQETDFSFFGMVKDVVRIRHLQVIAGIMISMYLVDTLVEYQFQVTAAAAYRGDNLTAFFGQFYGLYLNVAELIFQLFLTSLIVRRYGVGGTLKVSPVAVALSSIATVVAPGTLSAGAVRLTEASTRYTLNRTGMELLYMPLPQALRNRVKAFIDICVDRASRGIAGVLLLLLTATSLHLGVRGIAVVVTVLCVPWIYLSHIARKEYVASIRRRFESRRLDFDTARIAVDDPATVRMLETTAAGENPRQAVYALSLLAETPGYRLRPLLIDLVRSSLPEVRARVFELAASRGVPDVVAAANGELERCGGVAGAAVFYLVKVSPERSRIAAAALEGDDPERLRATLEALRADGDLASELITGEWLELAAASEQPARRQAAALAVAVRGDHETEVLHSLLADPSCDVAREACACAGELRGRAYLFPLIDCLANPRLRGAAVEALARFGPWICGTLSDVLIDEAQPIAARRQVPRVLKRIPHQRSVDVLLAAAGHQELSIRAAVLKALNHLREAAPALNFDDAFVTERILDEARYYYKLNAALLPFRDRRNGERCATQLLARTIDERLAGTLERLFRLLGLRYPPKEIYAVWLAVSRRRQEQATAALEFLENTMDRNLKRFLLPLLDAPESLPEQGLRLFGLAPLNAEDAIRELIRSRDPWLVACAISAAGELRLHNLAPEIAEAAAEAQTEVAEVARRAGAALAA
jgi:ATP:ADP antiporter, AAA family